MESDSRSEALPILFHPLHSGNLEQLKRINSVIFPIKYQVSIRLEVKHRKYAILCCASDGNAYFCRILEFHLFNSYVQESFYRDCAAAGDVTQLGTSKTAVWLQENWTSPKKSRAICIFTHVSNLNRYMPLLPAPFQSYWWTHRSAHACLCDFVALPFICAQIFSKLLTSCDPPVTQFLKLFKEQRTWTYFCCMHSIYSYVQ